MKRNFYFTTEARYLFRYTRLPRRPSPSMVTTNVWVFVNGQLALDLGAPHERLEGSVRCERELRARGWQDLRDRRLPRRPPPARVDYQLTLSGFSTVRSVCTPRCGDGQVTAGEECDLGDGMNNDTTYNGCTTECRFGPFCGDGVVNGDESCDDGRNITVGYNIGGCAPAASSRRAAATRSSTRARSVTTAPPTRTVSTAGARRAAC
jgi:fibro-slime domain-containing protein